MKLLDKYLLRTLLVPFIYCLLAFVLLYIVFDLFSTLNDFVEARVSLSKVVRFYIQRTPSAFFVIFPVSLLLATLYAMHQLTRSNEIIAIRASGISLYRVIVPFVMVGFLVSILVAVLNETVGPDAIYWTHMFLRLEKTKDVRVYVATDLGYVNAAQSRDWLIGEFDSRTFEMRNIRLTQYYPDGSSEKINAERGQWLDGRWWFFDVIRQRYDPEGAPIGVVRFQAREEMVDLTELPQDFLNEIKDPLENPDYVSAAEIRRFMETHKLAHSARTRLRVNYHSRLAIPWASLVVSVFGVPLGAHSGRRGRFMGIFAALLMFFVYFSSVQLCSALGKKGLLEAWIAAWLPNGLFLIAGLVFLHRAR